MRRFGELAAVIMDRLWELGRPALVREMVDDLHEDRALAYTTVITVMDKLYRKGWLGRQSCSRPRRGCYRRGSADTPSAGPAEPLGRARWQLLRTTAAALALTPVLLALAPAVLALALGRLPTA
jgi:hypothetical protein